MDKQQKLKIALPVLVVIMALVWGPVIMGGGAKKNKKEGVGSIGTSIARRNGSMNLAALPRSGKRKKARTSHDEWGRNPFELIQYPLTLIVEGIVWDEEDPKAIINGNIVSVGDNIGPNVIIDIRKDGVTVRNGMKEFEFNFGISE